MEMKPITNTKRLPKIRNQILYGGQLTMQFMCDQGLKLDNSRLDFHKSEIAQARYRRARMFHIKDAIHTGKSTSKIQSN